MNWHDTPPAHPGLYMWRRTWQWEPVERYLPEDRMVFSHRFAQKIAVEKLGGQWLYESPLS